MCSRDRWVAISDFLQFNCCKISVHDPFLVRDTKRKERSHYGRQQLGSLAPSTVYEAYEISCVAYIS